jgi:hypothetical protein
MVVGPCASHVAWGGGVHEMCKGVTPTCGLRVAHVLLVCGASGVPRAVMMVWNSFMFSPCLESFACIAHMCSVLSSSCNHDGSSVRECSYGCCVLICGILVMASPQPSARREPGVVESGFPFAPPPCFFPTQEAAFVLPHETPTNVRFNPGDPTVGLQWCCDVVNAVKWPSDTGKEMKWAVARALQQVVLPFMYDYCEYRRTSQAHLVGDAEWNQQLVLQLQAHLEGMSARMIEIQARARILEHSVSMQLGRIYRLQDEVKVLRGLGASPARGSSGPVDIHEAVRRAQEKAYRIRGGGNGSVTYSRSGCNTPMSLIPGEAFTSGASTPVSDYRS